ncbi:hypothetical protein [Bacillus massiliglaciei]|uniref:hypothetical protein n=1 Tax=Bacillus massiliglaciei TaxID=1816693 RepID=UPI000DA61D66|nr:hypothetical protein [Bacillus massiliglaciei]
MKKLFLIGMSVFVLILAACGNESTEDTAKDEQKQTEPTIEKKKETEDAKTEETTEKSEKAEPITWEDKVKEVATTDGSNTEKHDEIVSYARDYKATDDEIKEFENYIIQEYKDRNYLKDVTNHEYMLENIFKASVVDYHYDDSDSNPIQDFAFDFLQNTKYNYRGAETATSDSTLANEEQMNKALTEMK